MNIDCCLLCCCAAGFTSEFESRAEGDAHSSSSFPYDDIEETEPLASPGATDDAPGNAAEGAAEGTAEGTADDATKGAAFEPPEHLSQEVSGLFPRKI